MNRAVWKHLRPFAPGLAGRWAALAGRTGESLGKARLERIRAEAGADVARFVSLQRDLAERARNRLDVERLAFLTSKGAEQATAAPVARFRATRFFAAEPEGLPWDACCGIGSDLAALAERFDRLVATDLDGEPLRCAVASMALRRDAEGGGPDLVAALGRATEPPLSAESGARILGLFDPDRRPSGSRERNPDEWSPPLRAVMATAGRLAGACVKLPPSAAADRAAAECGGLGATAERSWISLDGELRELALWTGVLARGAAGPSAIALRNRSGPAAFEGAPHAPLPSPVDAESALRAGWLVELDPALQPSGLAAAFAHAHRLAPLAGSGAGGFYVAAHPLEREPSIAGLARSWRILAMTSGDRRRVRTLLRAHDIGPLVVKKRNHPGTADALGRSFRSPGSRPGLVAVTRVAGRSTVFLLEDRPPARDPSGQGSSLVGDEGLEPPTPSL